MDHYLFSIIFKLCLITNILISSNCYTILKSENRPPDEKIENDSEIERTVQNNYNQNIKNTPDPYSNIQIQYYFVYDSKENILTQINFSGYLKRYIVENEIFKLKEEFQINSISYEDLIYTFRKSGFLTARQYDPTSQHFIFPLYSVALSYREVDNDQFKNLVLYLPLYKRYNKTGIKKLYNKLLETAEDSHYKLK